MDSQITVADGSSFPNDSWVLVSTGQYRYGTSGLIAEYARVISGGGTNTLTLDRLLTFPYLTSNNATVTLTNFVENVKIEGFTIKVPTGTDGGNIFCNISRNIQVIGNDISGMHQRAGVRFRKSLSCHIFGQNNIHDGQDLATYGYGVSFDEYTQYCSASNNTSSNMREWTFSNNAMYCTMSDNNIVNAYDTGINTHGTGTWYCSIINNKITGCNIGISVGWGSDLAADVGIVVDGNVIQYSKKEGIQIASNASHTGNDAVEIKGNRIFQASLSGSVPAIRVLRQAASTSCYIQDNTVYAPSASMGIWVQNSDEVKLYDNNIIDGGNYGIRLDNSTDTVLRDNKVDDYNLDAYFETGTVTGTVKVGNTFA